MNIYIPLGIVLGLGACNSNGSDNPAASPSASAAASATSPAPKQESKLDKIFSADAIGENVTYLEGLTGPDFSTSDLGGSGGRSEKENTYKVDGCKIVVGVTGGRVDNIGIDNYSKKCSFDIGKFFSLSGDHERASRMSDLTELSQRLGGSFFPSCLALCGNAVEPSVYVLYDGTHADNFNQLMASADIISGDPHDVWSKELAKKYGEDYLAQPDPAKDNLSDLAAKLYNGVHPTSVRVGFKLFGPGTPL